jgi:citrate lyase subunit beta/citryl-CoA lyase
MTPRSWLFVPGDSERKQAKALTSGADALILDLEDSVAAAQLPAARERVREFVQAGSPQQQLWVRVNAPASGLLDDDVRAVIGSRPHGLVLPKISSAAQIAQIDRALSAAETGAGVASGSTQLLIIATETPQSLFALNTFATASQRVIGLTWGHEDLAAAIGARSKFEADGSLIFTFQLARSMCLLAAAASGVAAIDGVHAEFRDLKTTQSEAERAYRDGFAGKLAIHPDQVPVINAAFMPSTNEIAQAQRIVAAFEAAPGAGVISLDGRMLDRPHLVQAQRVLALATHKGR